MSEAGWKAAGPHVFLLDIEGTVAPLWLTSEVLFPYARAHFEEFLRKSLAEFEDFVKQSAEAIQQTGFGPADMGGGSIVQDLALLRMENEQDPEAPQILSPGSDPQKGWMNSAFGIPQVLAYVKWLMDRDRKSTALKSLQGKIWKRGFESGELKGTLFDDVPPAFQCWSQQGRVAIYSSGSTEAQQLLFRYSSHGDLTSLISAYFDTRVGAKAEPASYSAIARAMQTDPAEILFFSDAVRELDAARQAGYATRLVVRPGNPPIADAHGHPAVESFTGL